MVEDFSILRVRLPVPNTEECQGRQPVLVFYLAARTMKSTTGRGKVTQAAPLLFPKPVPTVPAPKLSTAGIEDGVLTARNYIKISLKGKFIHSMKTS